MAKIKRKNKTLKNQKMALPLPRSLGNVAKDTLCDVANLITFC